MGRLTNNAQVVFNKKLFKAFDMYRKLRRESQEIPLKEFIKDHDLTRNGNLITYKAFSDFLKRFYGEYYGACYNNGIWSQQTWRSAIIPKMYRHLQRQWKNRQEITKIIETRLKLPEPVVNNALRNANLGKDKLSQDKVNAIMSQYHNGMPSSKLLKIYKLTEKLFNIIAKEQNIVVPDTWHEKGSQIKYIDFTNHNPVTAHFLGLIWADGSIAGSGGMNIALDYGDYNYLDSLRQIITLDTRYPALPISKHSKDTGRYSNNSTVTLSIARKAFINYLKKIGFVSNKEKIPMELPTIIADYNDELFWSFLRGFFEGDGHLSAHTNIGSKKRNIALNFAVTKELGLHLKQELSKRFKIKSSMSPDKTIYRLTVGGSAPVSYMLIAMYSTNQSVIMNRKYLSAQEKYHQYKPDYINDLFPKLDLKLLLDLKKKKLALRMLSKRFSMENFEIHMINRKKNIEFKGSKLEFINKYDIKKGQLIPVLSLRKKSVDAWEYHPDYIKSAQFKEHKSDVIRMLKSGDDIIHIIHSKTSEEFKGEKHNFLMHYDINYLESFEEVLRGRKKSVQGWSLHPEYLNSNKFRNKQLELLKKLPNGDNIIHMIHPTTGREYKGKKKIFIEKYVLHHIDLLNQVLRGRKISVMGWKLHPVYKDSDDYKIQRRALLKKLKSGKDIIHLMHKDTQNEFLGSKRDFLKEHDDINIDYLNDVLRGVRRSTRGWIKKNNHED